MPSIPESPNTLISVSGREGEKKSRGKFRGISCISTIASAAQFGGNTEAEDVILEGVVVTGDQEEDKDEEKNLKAQGTTAEVMGLREYVLVIW